ncbi:MAG: nucleotidyl transferase AbiEii/AbiGii toxin family protein [Deltaproteobacteria bacterium]|nr:nucleotidyl transferase AbiEii/AbiGii toxin family protein [Deltaproteobacteria bacterium]
MICGHCFTREHIEEQGKGLGMGKYVQLEKCINALQLLGNLAETDLSFMFKGGTSLLLHLKGIKRLSIDIDIMCASDQAVLEQVIEQISALHPFTRWEENKRGERGLPARRHFKFFYPSVITNEENHVLLDVVMEPDLHLSSEQKPIRAEFIEVDREVLVTVPTVDALIGDKLTAFAPNTIGVPYRSPTDRSMAMQIIKQLFDVGELFSRIQSLENLKTAYEESYRLEAGYRQSDFSLADALADSRATALQLCCNGLDFAGQDEEVVRRLKSGIRKLRDHLVRDPFTAENEVVVAAAKVILLSRIIEGSVDVSQEQLSFNLVAHRDFILSSTIPEPECLNDLKMILPEAFYYLALAFGG